MNSYPTVPAVLYIIPAAEVTVEFHSRGIPEHGLAILTEIDTSNGETLQCLTDKTDCCSATEGSWLYPNGSKISTGSDSTSQM